MIVMSEPSQPHDTAAQSTPRDMLLVGDALDVLRTLASNSVDAIVTDPPAGISFMGRDWDADKGGRDAWIAWLSEIMREALRVLRPGGHALVWALPRTSHWTGTALEDAGFEIRDRVSHLFGSGFPKSLDVSKAIDKHLHAERPVVGKHPSPASSIYTQGDVLMSRDVDLTAPSTDAARAWDGWGTALKPAVEDWWLCRKPLAESTVARQVLATGTGALNIDGCRVPCGDGETVTINRLERWSGFGQVKRPEYTSTQSASGRWPAHLVLSHSTDCTADDCHESCPVAELDRQSGVRTSGLMKAGTRPIGKRNTFGQNAAAVATVRQDFGGDSGGASRFFTQCAPDSLDDVAPFLYASKPSRAERNAGLSAHSDGNTHPTVKSQALMRWLVRLITPQNGTVLDCFAGSGSTLVACVAEGMHFVGIERETAYAEIARTRVAHALAARHATPRAVQSQSQSQPKPRRRLTVEPTSTPSRGSARETARASRTAAKHGTRTRTRVAAVSSHVSQIALFA